jgi:D-alanyl-D-alanine carboxypeptidase/D-alanyl-D-alanine-endopeptidase (penicillin-binding protein 4)
LLVNKRSVRTGRRAKDPLKVVLGVGVLGGVILASGYFVSSSFAERVTPLESGAIAQQPKTVVLSARRTPNTLSNDTRLGGLRRSLANLESRVPSDGCLTVEWLGQSLSNVRGNKLLVPASAVKVLTAATALEVLGPTFTYKTEILATKTESPGVVTDLFIVGGGDPVIVRNEYVATEKYKTFNGTPLETLADQIVATGIRTISGSIVGIDSRYDDKRFVDVWPSEFHFTEAGPLGALMVNDGVVVGEPVKPDDPALASVTELRSMLIARGVAVSGPVRHDPSVPSAATAVTTVSSSPLPLILREMLVNSDNNTAELILKEIGYDEMKAGSTAAGLDVVAKYFADKKIAPVPTLLDGSGLSSSNKASCESFMSLLNSQASDLAPLLAIAGTSGTLINAFEDSPMKGRLLGKTGTLSGVKSLVGYLPVEGGQPVVFAFIMNATGIDNRTAYRPLWNALGDALNRAKSTPRADQLAP